MKRLLKLIPIIILVVLSAGALALAWIIGTTNGARWLLRTASGHISAGEVKGRLAGPLHLKNVRITLPNRHMELDTLELRWKPILLLTGMVGINELTVSGVRIQDDSPPSPTPPDLSWPRAPRLAELFDATVDRLRIDRFSYRHGKSQPLIINSLTTSLTWQEMRLSSTNLALVTPSGSLSGSAQAGLKKPSLSASLVAVPTQPLGGMERLELQTRLLPGSDPEQLAGSIAVNGTMRAEGKVQRLELTGEAGMTRNAINLRKLSLTGSGLTGSITGEGSLSLASVEPLLTLTLRTAGLDLKSLVNQPTDLNGTVTVRGTMNDYKGKFALTNKGQGWQAANLAADFTGNRNGLVLSPLKGGVLDGTVQGNLEAEWSEGFMLRGAIRARNLDPARLSKEWKGAANLDLTANMNWPQQGPARGTIQGTILESRLHGQPLTGGVKAEFVGDNLIVERFDLQGRGFDIHAKGELKQRLNVTARAEDLSRLVPGTSGNVRASGWVAWRDGQASGEIDARGRKLSMDKLQMDSLALSGRVGPGATQSLQVTADVRRLIYGNFQADSVRLDADGTVSRHRANMTMTSAAATAQLVLSGSYDKGTWQGKIARLSGGDRLGKWALDAPVDVVLGKGKITLSPLAITSAGAERFELTADLTRAPLRGVLNTRWTTVKLARAGEWLKDVRLTGTTSGSLRMNLLPGERIDMAGKASALGSLTTQGHTVVFRRGEMTISAGEQGMKGGIELQLDSGGMLKGTLASSAPARLELPRDGDVSLEMKDLDLVLIRPWLPEEVTLQGKINGRASGKMLAGQRFELQGSSELATATVRWNRPEGEMSAALRTATAAWQWRNDALTGSFSLALADVGQARGDFNLPLPARLPVAFKPDGPVQASLNGQVRETGMLTALFPGVVQEASGTLDINLKAAGQWAKPQFNGTAQLTKAAAYLPSAGIRVSDVQLMARLEKDLIRIESFRATSGSGNLSGNALLRLAGWQLASYSGSLNGESFQTVYFPELQIQSSPKLTFEGNPRTLKVRGEVRLPEFRITGPPTKAAIGPSSDVILEGRSRPGAQGGSPLELDVQVRVVLGDRVFVKLEGIDAQLGGSMDIALQSLDRITSRGEIKVVKGRYQTYGVNLDIVRGRLFYAGGSVNRPTLDILALRTVGGVKAGVTVGGTLLAPVIKLYSEPAMPDVDILSYVVIGRPLGSSSGEQVGLMTQAAGVLLSTGQSAVLQDQIKSRLGLSTLEIQTAGPESAGRMGYKPIEVAPPGSARATQSTGISQTMITVGKYLTPQLYVSYGRSIFTEGNLFLLRYDIFKNWQIETQTGTESGVDLYYKIEFK